MNFSLALAAARGTSGSRMLDGASRRERASRNSMEAVIFRLGAGRRKRRPFTSASPAFALVTGLAT